MKTFILIALPIAFGISGQLLLKTGLAQIGHFSVSFGFSFFLQILKILTNPYVFLGFMCYALSSIVWIVTISRLPLSFAYPMLSINYIGVLLGSKYLLGEEVNMYRWAGVVIICFGVAFIGASGNISDNDTGAEVVQATNKS